MSEVYEGNWADDPPAEEPGILEQIASFYQTNVFPQPGLRCNDVLFPHEPSIEIQPLAKHVDVNRLGDQFCWKLDLPEQLSERMSETTINTTMSRHEINRLRHEFVAEALHLGNTDVPFKSVYPLVDDGMDGLTPDFIERDISGVMHCIEVATTRSTEDHQLKAVADTKIFKYKNAIFLRSQHIPSTLTVLVVNQHGVHSNVNLGQNLVDDLMIRYKLMIALENVGKEKGFEIFIDREDEALNEMALDIEDQIKQVTVDANVPDDGLNISVEFIKECLLPVNYEKVKEAFKTSVEQTDIGERSLKTTPEMEAQRLVDAKCKVKDFVKGFEDKNRERTTKCKPVINLPKVIPAISEPSTRVKFIAIGNSTVEKDLVEAWKKAMSQVAPTDQWKDLPKSTLLREAMETKKEKLQELKMKRKARMVKRGRVTLPLKKNSPLSRYFEKDGIKSKRSRHEAWRKQRRKEQSKTLSYNTDLTDIEDYVNGSELFEKGEGSLPDSFGNILKLVDSANEMVMNDSTGLDFIRDISETLLFKLANFISELSSELTVTLSQFTKPEEVILKKMRNYDCYLLLMPSGKKNPIGWSMLIPKKVGSVELKEFIGRPLIETSSCWISTLTTTMPDKLENMWSLPSTVICLYSFLAYYYNIQNPTVELCKRTPGFKEALNLLVALRLEDKAETEETVTLTRYMYMEVMKTGAVLSKPDPMKMISKFNTKPRSRLNLFLEKRIIGAFLSMVKTPPSRSRENDFEADSEQNDPLPTDNWNNMISYLDLQPINSATKCLSLFYLGYLKNKNAVAQGNTNWLLLEKTIEEELKIDWNNPDGYSGKAKTNSIPSSHQFNTECIKAGVETLERRLESTYGPEWKNAMGKKVLLALSRESSFRMATLKASSTTNDEDVSKRVCKGTNRPVHRRKMLEAIADNIELCGVNPYRKLGSFLAKRRRGSKKARADLFKKQQHGGLREIYVLDLVTRVLQLFIETCSRVLCREFEEESLTNPKRKLPIINQHFQKTKKYAASSSRYCVNYNCSLDKTRWNQGFMIRAISIALFRMLPSEFHGTIQTIMNMWIGKDLKIPPEVIDLLLSDIRLSSPAYEVLRQDFYGLRLKKPGLKPLVKSPQTGYISTYSGFMQGILHYTSSLTHLAFLALSKSMLHKVIHSTMPGASSLISYTCSSDDSAIMVSLFFPKTSKFFSKELIMMSDQLEKLLHSLENFCKFFCMRPSVKSTVAMLDSVEFNSEFIFNNTLAIPVFKFVVACVNSIPYESLVDKLNGQYNLLSSVLASGFPSWNTHLCQIAQAINHYKSLGVGFSPLEEEITQLIMELKEPNYGFFPMDTQRAPGLMGLPYTLYRVYRNTGVLPVSSKNVKKDPIVSIEGGVPSESLHLTHGDSRKQKKLLLGLQQVTEGRGMRVVHPTNVDKFTKQLNQVKEQIVSEVNDNYELFYRAASSPEEVILKLKLKALMPGVSKSLGSGNTHIQNTAASLYSAHTACMLLSVERFREEEVTTSLNKGVIKDIKSVKASFYRALILRTQERKEQLQNPQKPELMETTCFPLLEKYKEFDSVVYGFMNATEVKVSRFRNQKNKIDILPYQSRLPLSLLEVVKIRWFGHKNPTSQSVLNRCVEIYQQSYPWLMDTHNTSLEASPFTSPTELFSFINSINDGSRTVLVTSPSISVNGFLGQVSNFIKKNYKQCIVLRRPVDNKKKSDTPRRPKDQLDLSLFITNMVVLRDKVEGIIKTTDFFPPGQGNILEMSRHDLSLYVIQKAMREDKESVIDFLSDLLHTCASIYQIMYTHEQRKVINENNEVKWMGPGEAILKIGKDVIILRMSDQKLVEIRAQAVAVINRNLKSLNSALRELNLVPEMAKFEGYGTVAKYNGDRLVSKNGIGCPIKVDTNAEARHLLVKDFKIEITKGRINLKYLAGASRWIRLVSYTARKDGIDTSHYGPEKDDCWDAWTSVSPWKGENALLTVEAVKETLEKMEKQSQSWRKREPERKDRLTEQWERDAKEFKLFLSSSLKARIMNVRSQRLYMEECLSTLPDTEDDELDYDIDDDFLNQLHSECLDLGSEDYGQIVSGIMPDITIKRTDDEEPTSNEDDIDELLASMSMTTDPALKELAKFLAPGIDDNPLSSILYRKATTEFTMMMDGLISRPRSILSVHPLWDDLIRKLDRIDNRFISSLLEGIASAYDPDSAKLLMWLLDIKERNMRVRGMDLGLGRVDSSVMSLRHYFDSLKDLDSDSD